MGVSVEQWRRTIGRFHPSKSKDVCDGCEAEGEDVSLVKGILVWLGLLMSILLILAGDVEVNPGPSSNQVISKDTPYSIPYLLRIIPGCLKVKHVRL